MKQILLVDDDFLALNLFYSLMDWQQLELHIAFEAHGGREALAYLETCAELPDIAFIDVCMPDMDGIALLQTLRAQYPSIVCFMLSSHSDYPYVRETLKLGAADYMLKHEISPERIVAALREQGLVSAMQEPTVSADEQFLNALCTSESYDLRGYLLHGVYTGTRPLLKTQRNSILQTCRHILNRISGAVVCMPTEDALAVALPAKEDEPSGQADAIHTASLLQKALTKYHNAQFLFPSPVFCADGSQAARQFAAMNCSNEQEAASHAVWDEHQLDQLTLAVASGSRLMVAQALQALFQANEHNARELHNRLLSFLTNTRNSMGLPSAEAVPSSVTDIHPFFLRQFSALCDENTCRTNAAFSSSIREALSFIDSHYAEDIQLSDVAQHCHLSYTHLSYLFKKETGDNLIRYLTRIRVYHAARMLLFNGLTVSETCQQSGFKSYNHFVTTFKTLTGMTPSEFRKNPAAAAWLLSFYSQAPKKHDI